MEEKQIIVEEEKGISLADLFFIIKKNLIMIIIVTGLCTVLGGVYGLFFKNYTITSTATAVVMVDTGSASTTQSDYQNYLQATYMINTYSTIIKSNMVAKDVVESPIGQKYNLTLKGVTAGTSVSTTSNSLIITITYKCSAEKATEKEKAQEIVNQVLQSTINVVNSKDEDGKYVYDKLANCIKTVDAASEYTTTASRGASMVIVICFAVGFVLSFGICLIKYLVDDTYTSKDDFEKQFNINVLTLLPDLSEKEIKSKKGGK